MGRHAVVVELWWVQQVQKANRTQRPAPRAQMLWHKSGSSGRCKYKSAFTSVFFDEAHRLLAAFYRDVGDDHRGAFFGEQLGARSPIPEAPPVTSATLPLKR